MIPFFLIVLIQLFFLINSRFTPWPEMILYPWLINNHYSLYTDIINPYFPLLPIFLSVVYKLFGVSLLTLKVVTYFFIFSTDLIIYFFVKKLTADNVKAAISVLIYLFLQLCYGGNGLWFELALTPLILLSIWMIYFKANKRSVLLSGLCLGLAVLAKQNAVLFYLPLIYLLYGREKKLIGYLLLPGIFLGAVTIISLSLTGTLGDFYNWAVNLALHLSSSHGFIIWPSKLQYLLILVPILPFLFIKKDKLFWAITGLVAVSFAFPRYEDFHLQLLVGLSAVVSSLIPKKWLAIFLLISLILFLRSEKLLWHKQDRFLDEQAVKLSQEASSYNSVFLLNAPNLAYFLSNKLPPKPWTDNFPWYYENNGFEQKFIADFDKQKVQTVIIGKRLGGDKYTLGNYIPDGLISYITGNYNHTKDYQNFEIWQRK